MRRSRATLDTGHEEPLLNLTPLIDVIMVVLIMFIIVAPMLEIDKVELAAAAQNSTKECAALPESSPLAIYVHADDSIWFHKRKVSAQELSTQLKEWKRRQPKLVPLLFHDKNAHFGIYQSVKNAVEQAGYEELDVILQPK